MDEQLKAALLEILQDARNGLPDAFRMLVDQRAGACGVEALSGILFVIMGILGVIYGARWYGQNESEPKAIMGICGVVVGAVGALAGIIIAVNSMSGWLYPLGGLL